ncbi:MAG: hypothetical protein DMF89_27010 [Acidobacteria bacterium]|nr:MAG: hypothetical protein DMF90_01380 [Acidobacteriota bacterium]PYR44746.1 MAG: hypothetical protein DMF89_27010 [Acidobacteriota bacterium]
MSIWLRLRLAIAAVVAALSACSGSPSAASGNAGAPGNGTATPAAGSAGALSLQAAAWSTISDSPRVALGNDRAGQLVFDFPTRGGINYLYNTSPPNTIAGSVSVSLEIATTGPVYFNFMTEPSNTCSTPSSVRPFFWSHENGEGEFDRWWSNPIAYVLAAGSRTLSIPISPDRWSSVFGKMGNADAAATVGFNRATGSVSRLGLTFGGGCFFGHGVFVQGGTARFTLVAYQVQ